MSPPQATNILCVEQFANLGGGQRSLLDLLPAFSASGWQPFVAVPGAGAFTTLLERSKYPILKFNLGAYESASKPARELVKYAFEFPRLTNALKKLVEAHHIDLIYVNGSRILPAAAVVAWLTGVPLVFHCHNRLFQRSAIALTGWSLKLAHAQVIACCRHAAEPLAAFVEPEHLRVVFNGVADMATSDIVSRGRFRNIGVIGRVEKEKGQLEFVQAARLISPQVPDCRFKIIGSAMFSSADYHKQVIAQSHGLPIDFVAWQNNVAEVLADLDLLVVPSKAVEATTRVILEAYSASVPVVSFPSGGIPEVLHDGTTGFLTSDHTVAALAHRMLSVLEMRPEELRPIVAAARKEWNKHFNLRAYRRDVCQIVSQVLDATPSHPYEDWLDPDSIEPLWQRAAE